MMGLASPIWAILIAAIWSASDIVAVFLFQMIGAVGTCGDFPIGKGPPHVWLWVMPGDYRDRWLKLVGGFGQ